MIRPERERERETRCQEQIPEPVRHRNDMEYGMFHQGIEYIKHYLIGVRECGLHISRDLKQLGATHLNVNELLTHTGYLRHRTRHIADCQFGATATAN